MGGGTVVGGGLGTVVLLLLAWYFGIDPTPLLQQMQVDSVPEQQQGTAPDLKNDPMADFVAAVLGDTEDTWQAIFARKQRPLCRSDPGAVHRQRVVRVRLRPGGDGAFLLLAGSEGIHRPRLL